MKLKCQNCKEYTDVKHLMRCSKDGKPAIICYCSQCGNRIVKMIKVKQSGDGIMDVVKTLMSRISTFISGRKPGSPELMKFIEQHATEKIKKITVCREPVSSAVTSLLNIITLGAWNKITKANVAYDRLFHLFLVFETESGSYRTERNEIVRVYSGNVSGESVNVNVSRDIDVGSFFGNVLKREGDRIFVYSAFSNNCQDFIYSLLLSNGLANRQVLAFIKQDLTDLVKQLPGYIPSLADKITGFAARLRILQGKGKKKKYK